MSINKVDIANFGSFKGFIWKKAIKDNGGNILNFKRLNIIYGRNYSGKTTLSRIFRSLQTGCIPINYSAPSFTISGDRGEVNQSGISAHGYDVRVYNRDFVSDNLSFLVNQDGGEIKTFAIVGEKNKEIEDEIAAIEVQLGSIEKKSGLKHELEEKRKEKDRAKNNHKIADDALAAKLRTHANDIIKNNREYGTARYYIDSIKQDIASTKMAGFKSLSDDEKPIKIALLKQEVLPDISGNISISLKFSSLAATAESLLQRTITPTQAVQELLNDSVLQSWVKDGRPHHRDKRDTCAFCRQKLPHDIWQVLDSHFNKESDELESEIDSSIASVDAEIKRIPTFLTLTNDKFYAEERIDFDTNKKSLDACLDVYKQDLEALKTALQQRKNSLFQTVVPPSANHDTKLIDQYVEAINELIKQSNSRSKTLDEDKTAARDALRLSDVASFISTIGYDAELNHIAGLKNISETANTAFVETEKTITRLDGEVTILRGKQKDERKGADRVNALLNHFFGHNDVSTLFRTQS